MDIKLFDIKLWYTAEEIVTGMIFNYEKVL